MEIFGSFLGFNDISQEQYQRKPKQNNIKSLKQLVIQIMQSKKYPKSALSAAYAFYCFPSMFDQWQKESTIGTDVKVEEFENDIPFWFSYPERNVSTGEMPCNSLDCSHIFKTHLRVLTCTSGFGNVTSEGWKACARSNATALK